MKNKQALYTIIGNFVYLIAQWALTVVVVRFADDFYAAGILSLAMTIANIFYVIACYGIRAFQVSDINHEFADQCYLLSRIISIVAALIGCVAYVWVKGYDFYASYCVLIYMIYKCFEAESDVIYGVFQMQDDFEHICISMSVKGILSFAVFTAALATGQSLPVALWSMNVVAIGTLIAIDLRWCRKYTHPLLIVSRKMLGRVKTLMWITFPAMLVLICQPLLMSIPRLFFERNFSTEQLGIYSSISAPTVAISTFVSCVMTPYIPLFAEYFTAGDKQKIKRLTFGLLGFGVGVGLAALIGGYFLGEWALTLLYGEKIGGYLDIFLLVILVTTCSALMLILDSLYIAIRKQIPLAVILLLGCLICWIVTPFFVTTFAMRGVTYALLAAQLIQIGASLILAMRYFSKMTEQTI